VITPNSTRIGSPSQLFLCPTLKYMEYLGQYVYLVSTWKPNPNLDEGSNTLWFTMYLMDILMIYDAVGQRESGYILVRGLVTQAIESNRIPEPSYVDQEFLPAMGRFYAENTPFIPPDLVGPDARPIYDEYAEDS
jgi:hypothetical protein